MSICICLDTEPTKESYRPQRTDSASHKGRGEELAFSAFAPSRTKTGHLLKQTRLFAGHLARNVHLHAPKGVCSRSKLSSGGRRA